MDMPHDVGETLCNVAVACVRPAPGRDTGAQVVPTGLGSALLPLRTSAAAVHIDEGHPSIANTSMLGHERT